MVTNIPTHEDFTRVGIEQTMFSLDMVLNLLSDLSDYDPSIDHGDSDENDEALSEYWTAAHRILTNATSTLQQGVEFLIKGRIAAVSPYLLIDNSRELGKFKNQESISFASFRTIDAQDLILLNNIFTESRLSEEFTSKYTQMRELRNSIMHTIDSDLNITVKEVIISILEVVHTLLPEIHLPSEFKEYYENSPPSILYGDDGSEGNTEMLFWRIYELLNRSERQKYMDIGRGRKYFCPVCYEQCQIYSIGEPKMAVLSPNSPQSEDLYCYVCNVKHPIKRENCMSNAECQGNVIYTNYEDFCCSCGSSS
ncbi:MAG: hypothetical protein ACJAR1_002493 [Rubritalea sp.]|jgi:hypothetical protein